MNNAGLGAGKPAAKESKKGQVARLAELYYSGIARQKRVNERLDRLRVSAKELKNCTFKPEITALAKALEPLGVTGDSQQVVGSNKSPALDSLYYRGVELRKRVEKRLDSLRVKTSETKHCTFKPEITVYAKTMERSGSLTRCQRHNRQMRQRMLLESWKARDQRECRAMPAISRGSELIVQRARSRSACLLPVEDRLYMDSVRRQYKMEEERTQQEPTPLRRSSSDMDALIHRLYEFEEKRIMSVERLREKIWSEAKPKCRYESNGEFVERLFRAVPKQKPRKDEPRPSFEPHINGNSKGLSVRAYRRRLEQWYRLWSRQWSPDTTEEKAQLIGLEHIATLKKIDEVLQLYGITKRCTLDRFCSALEAYEKEQGVQGWRLCSLPMKVHVNEQLTFAPVTHSSRNAKEDCVPVHERLYEIARAKQHRWKEEERRMVDHSPERGARNEGTMDPLSRNNSNRSARECVEVKEKPPLPPPSSPRVCDTDGFSDCRSVELSSLSTSYVSDTIPAGFSPPPIWLTPEFIKIVEELQHVINEPSRAGETSASCTGDNVGAASRYVQEGVAPSSGGSRVKKRKKKKSYQGGGPFSGELLLECAASRRQSFSSDVSARRREARDSERHLRRVGKMLYRSM
uniref:Uncharacterized protein TCIL3000_10_110 n=1 Tax=Trypanosoma congolense (strain IL3000) TaxID=1068625 RepID=G0UV38_TRYCI|nr:unnamed protein product [Trypanosoma congolense IL3000]